MSRSLQSNIWDAEVRRNFWLDVAKNLIELEDRGITKEDALVIAEMFTFKLENLEEREGDNG